jgi:hypothetical protein
MAQVSKLNYVDGKLGAPTSGQQTTRVLFNTIDQRTNQFDAKQIGFYGVHGN